MTRNPAVPIPAQMSQEDREAYEYSGFGRSVGFGNRPAVLVIDVQHRTVGPRLPILEAMQASYPTACGERAWAAIDNLPDLLAAARAADVPIFYPCVAPKEAETIGGFGRLNPLVGSVDAAGYNFIESVAPQPGDVPVPKQAASSFFGTPLNAYLIDRGVDTLILVGCTTSGCVRATAVDAFSLNYRTVVVSDGVYDRAQMSHDVGLFEMDAKYADVRTATDIIEQLRS